ncbi:uncharacterized protein LOC127366059 isoform X1 [Dicentrarchus labrax]|uniref:uncharacterized protein LOC127366059 isoform X1 n=1 Tax=Dicentrarchus labrax TaxID=13489 RepID=UPI0021F5AA62|nr:uncharacterized protein LOC127366059 isoform X1 [Dicentrarchus labrax]
MFSLKAVLLSIQLSVMCQVFAGVVENRCLDKLVFRGDSIMFTCNTSMANITQIRWTKGISVFIYSVINNKTFSNSTSHRLRIDSNSSTKLHVINAQCDDEGLYICDVISTDGLSSVVWNLTVSEVSEKPEEVSSSWYFLYILTSVIGSLLCGFTSAFCLCRKLRARTPNQNPVQHQFPLESREEAAVTQPEGGTERRAKNKKSSQYMERLNSIYGV